MRSYTLLLVLALVVMLLVAFALCDDTKEREECAESVVGLATCLPFVEVGGGTANSPTPDCCTALKQVLSANNKCVCVMIKDRNDPDLGLNINLTLALYLPQACNAPANISQCPALLKLPPDSADAQIFYQLGQNSNNATHVAGGPNDNVEPGPSSVTTPGSSGELESDGCYGNGKRIIGLKIFGGLLFLWSVI